MKFPQTLSALFLTAFYICNSCARVRAHGGHGNDGGQREGETMQEYAKRHMVTEHHIDAFDLTSFFALHDLDSNGVLDAAEIEAIYGVHHLDSQRKSPDEDAHKAKAAKIVQEVLARMDTNRDGVLSPEEFEAAGFNGLPDFSSLGADGHHYDEESEFFLHHEEQYHNTPETQTDESYNHPEDIEHFKNHEKIELEEENKERKFQGLPELSLEDARKMHAQIEAELAAAAEKAAQEPSSAKFQRPPKNSPDPREQLKDALKEAKSKPDWGVGNAGFARPKAPADKLRRNVPYKYKFRKNWGDF